MLSICKDRKRKYQSLGISIDPKFWNFQKNEPKPNCPNREKIQKIILTKKSELQNKILELHAETKDFTPTSLLNDKDNKIELKSVVQSQHTTANLRNKIKEQQNQG